MRPVTQDSGDCALPNGPADHVPLPTQTGLMPVSATGFRNAARMEQPMSRIGYRGIPQRSMDYGVWTPCILKLAAAESALQPVSETGCIDRRSTSAQNKHGPVRREGEYLEEVQPFVRLEKDATSVIACSHEASGRTDSDVLLGRACRYRRQCGTHRCSRRDRRHGIASVAGDFREYQA